MTSRIKVVAFVRRRPDLDRAEFVRRWVEDHTALSARLGMSPYRINVAVEPQDDGSTPPYDGTAEMYWPDLAAFRSALAGPDGVLAGADTARFAASVELAVYEEFDVGTPPDPVPDPTSDPTSDPVSDPVPGPVPDHRPERTSGAR